MKIKPNTASTMEAPSYDRTMAVKAARASFIGTAVEWYDYFVYGLAAATVFPAVFFAGLGATGSLLASLATFGVAFFFRPLGGLIFGHFGDRISRKQALVVTLTIMGAGTFLIGCLPTIGQVGMLAPILLVVLRMIQGFGLGGEFGGAALLIVENARPRNRGLFASVCQIGVPTGQLLSAGLFTMFSALPHDQFFAWGWRVPFLLSGVLVGIGLYIRTQIPEPVEFAALKAAKKRPKAPLAEVMKNAKGVTFKLIFVQAAATVGYYLFTVYSVSYVKDQATWALAGVLIASGINLFAIPLYAALSDRVGRRPVYFAGTLFIGVFALPFFALLDTHDPVLIVIAVAAPLVFGWAPTGALNSSWYPEQYPTRYRYTGVSAAYQISSLVAGAPAALVAGALVAATGSSSAVSWYVITATAVSLVCVLALRETARTPLETE